MAQAPGSLSSTICVVEGVSLPSSTEVIPKIAGALAEDGAGVAEAHSSEAD